MDYTKAWPVFDGGKLPPMAELKEYRRRLAAVKKALYAEYHAAQRTMWEAVTVKASIGASAGDHSPRQE